MSSQPGDPHAVVTQQQYLHYHGQHNPPLPEDNHSGNSNWTPVLDSIVDEYNWDGEEGPSVWDPKLDPSRGRKLTVLHLKGFIFLC